MKSDGYTQRRPLLQWLGDDALQWLVSELQGQGVVWHGALHDPTRTAFGRYTMIKLSTRYTTTTI